jgi:hypothetical protein
LGLELADVILVALNHRLHVGPVELQAGEPLDPAHLLLVPGIDRRRKGYASVVHHCGELILHPGVVVHHPLAELPHRSIAGATLRHLAQPNLHQVRTAGMANEGHVRVHVGLSALGGGSTGLSSDRWILGRCRGGIGYCHSAGGAYLCAHLGRHGQMPLEHRQGGRYQLASLGRPRR